MVLRSQDVRIRGNKNKSEGGYVDCERQSHAIYSQEDSTNEQPVLNAHNLNKKPSLENRCQHNAHAQYERVTHVLRGQPAHGRIIRGQRRVDHRRLLLLQLDDTALDTVFDDELDRLHGTMLAKPMDAVHGLELDLAQE